MDECHHATKNHSYNIVMKLYRQFWTEEINKMEQKTKILGLTASVVSQKCTITNFFKLVSELEKNLK